MSAPPFRLLAITPPQGRVAAEVVDRWAAPGIGVGVLLRETARPEAALDPDGRLSAVARAARRRGHTVLWSAPASAVLARPWPIDGIGRIDGVQLRGDPSPRQRAAVRRHIGPQAILGRSVHGACGEASEDVFDDCGPRYIVFAPVFDPRTTSPGGPTKKGAGLPALRSWTSTRPHVFALGGVAPDNAMACVHVGAWGLASIRSFFAADASDQVRALADALG